MFLPSVVHRLLPVHSGFQTAEVGSALASSQAFPSTDHGQQPAFVASDQFLELGELEPHVSHSGDERLLLATEQRALL